MASPAASPFGLGRKPSTDPRNHLPRWQMEMHLMALQDGGLDLSPAALAIMVPQWKIGAITDQKTTPDCVGFADRDHVNAEPHAHPDLGPDGFGFYDACKAIDPDKTDDGTTIHIGAQVLKNMGLVKQYLWAYSEWTIRKWLMTQGPVIIGIDWWNSMFTPDAQNIVHVNAGDPNNFIAGGHAILLFGYDYNGFGKLGTYSSGAGSAIGKPAPPGSHALYAVQNSWGPDWGEGGAFYLPVGDLAFLMAQPGAEACAGVNWDGVPGH